MTPRLRRRAVSLVLLLAAASGVTTALVLSPAQALPAQELNLRRVAHVPIEGAVTLAFSSRSPVAYVLARKNGGTVVTLDITDPLAPEALAQLAVPSVAYMEDLSVGERDDGTTFLLIREREGLRVVDVTDPGSPTKRGFVDVESHTWTCVRTTCEAAYSTRDGFTDDHVEVVDLTDLDAPQRVAQHKTVVGLVHDWGRDASGVMWAVGGEGLAAYDASDARNPVLLNSSDAHGTNGYSEHNDWLQLHGSLRPNAHRFEPDLGAATASVERGNVLLVSEEGNDLDCTDSLQTWYVPHLDPARAAAENPTTEPGRGTITPLDTWSLLDVGVTPAGGGQLCSVHWFDYHQDGFVVVPTYASGTRVLDVRDARAIRQVAYSTDGDDEAVQSAWVPERDPRGRSTGRSTAVVYTADAGGLHGPVVGLRGGLDVFEAELPSRRPR